jgi:hypothetical protein
VCVIDENDVHPVEITLFCILETSCEKSMSKIKRLNPVDDIWSLADPKYNSVYGDLPVLVKLLYKRVLFFLKYERWIDIIFFR